MADPAPSLEQYRCLCIPIRSSDIFAIGPSSLYCFARRMRLSKRIKTEICQIVQSSATWERHKPLLCAPKKVTHLRFLLADSQHCAVQQSMAIVKAVFLLQPAPRRDISAAPLANAVLTLKAEYFQHCKTPNLTDSFVHSQEVLRLAFAGLLPDCFRFRRSSLHSERSVLSGIGERSGSP